MAIAKAAITQTIGICCCCPSWGGEYGFEMILADGADVELESSDFAESTKDFNRIICS